MQDENLIFAQKINQILRFRDLYIYLSLSSTFTRTLSPNKIKGFLVWMNWESTLGINEQTEKQTNQFGENDSHSWIELNHHVSRLEFPDIE